MLHDGSEPVSKDIAASIGCPRRTATVYINQWKHMDNANREYEYKRALKVLGLTPEPANPDEDYELPPGYYRIQDGFHTPSGIVIARKGNLQETNQIWRRGKICNS